MNDEYITIEVTATAQPVDVTLEFKDGHKMNLRIDEKVPAGTYTLEALKSITYYTATVSPDCSISLGVIGEDAGGSMKD